MLKSQFIIVTSEIFRPRLAAKFLAFGSVLAAIAATSTFHMQASAEPGQTNALETASHSKPTGFWIEEVADGFKFPSSMAWLPDGAMLVTCQDGTLQRVEKSRHTPDAVTGVPKSYPGVWNGLRDVVVDPDFQNSHLIYLYITEG